MSKKFSWTVLTFVLTLVFILALVSCDTQETPTGEPTHKPTEIPTEQSCVHTYDNACDGDCNLCGETRQTSHTEEILEAVDATCQATGLTEGKRCSVCEAVIVEQKVVEKKAHVEVVDLSKPASCTETGLTQGSHCDTCGEIIIAQQEIEKTPHLGGGILAAVKPTCTSTGLTRGETCLVCGEVVVAQEVLEMLPHSEMSIPAVPASCTATGLTEGKQCMVCNEILVEQTVVEALGHKYSEKYSYDDNYHWVTCTNGSCRVTGEKEAHSMSHYNCTVCDYYNGPAYYNIGSAPRKYQPKGYSTDTLYVAGKTAAGAGADVSIGEVSYITIHFGESIKLTGWIGFDSLNMTGFCYWFNDDIYTAEMRDAFMSQPEAGVLEAGGPLAKRFSISANSDNMENVTSVSFAVLLEDGTYIIIKRFEVERIGKVEFGETIPDDEVVKAGAEKLGDEELVVLETSTANTYTTPAGLIYTAAGGEFANGKFNISSAESFKVIFEEGYDRFKSEFNKYKISYSSTTPLKAIITYTDGKKLVTDTVYLEAGEHMFSCLTLGYVNVFYAKGITSVEIFVLGSEADSEFVLYDIVTEKVEIINGSTTYISNDRYLLGVNVIWGGGISYILDRNDNNNAITNLINNADTGRLIQQSYYGTDDPSEYECGQYGGGPWAYNPVQGGNVFAQSSRIIDVQISGVSIYIKAQPRDWAKKEIAPCYMENVYTIYSDRIQVDNRFVDFSGYKNHNLTHQELPAFYTIGYLNTFEFYNGTESWTNGELAVEDSLEFWGESKNPYFRLRKGNTETWCAWVNKSDDFGIGLYVPNVDMFIAGRHAYESDVDATDSASGSCSYVAPINSLRLVSYEDFEYSYLITTGSTQDIRDLFNQHKDFEDNEDLTSKQFSYISNRLP